MKCEIGEDEATMGESLENPVCSCSSLLLIFNSSSSEAHSSSSSQYSPFTVSAMMLQLVVVDVMKSKPERDCE